MPDAGSHGHWQTARRSAGQPGIGRYVVVAAPDDPRARV